MESTSPARPPPHEHSYTHRHTNASCPWSIDACTLAHPLALFICLVHYHLTSNTISSFTNAHAYTFHCALPSPFCNPYQLHCNSSVFLLIMSGPPSLFPACIDWSCPMHPALYLYSHNPQAQRAKIIVQTQRTHKSHIQKRASKWPAAWKPKQQSGIQTFSLMHFCHKYFSSINSGGVLDPV